MLRSVIFVVLNVIVCTFGAGVWRQCPPGLVFKRCANTCPKYCGFWNNPDKCASRRYCTPVCECPAGKYETWSWDLNPRCVASAKQCHCLRGQRYNLHGSVCTKTCSNPTPELGNPHCKKKVARCECPKNRPILHNGRCITLDRCVCGFNKLSWVETGCNECNSCSCKDGKLGPCTLKLCANTQTKQGAVALATGGCYREAPSGTCIYYNPCPDNKGNTCKKVGQGGCGCGCKCKGRKCALSKCKDDLIRRILAGEGGWAKIKQDCTFMVPGPEYGSGSCKGAPKGVVLCNQCNKCDCVYGLKVCSRKTCPKPKWGCVQTRSYVQERCHWVSPCNTNQGRCNYLHYLPEVKPSDETDYCYMYNKDLKICEFVRPCPEKCHAGDVICNECNKCTCRDGSVSCTRKECGDPLRQGCWRMKDDECTYMSPCSWGSYGSLCTPKHKPKYDEMYKDGCWSATKYGPCKFYYPCPW